MDSTKGITDCLSIPASLDQKKGQFRLSELFQFYRNWIFVPEVARMNKITFSQAIDGYLLFANARRLSHHTIRDYTTTFRKFMDHLDNDPIIEEVTHQQVETFLAAQKVSKKTLLNYHTGLSALWSWCLNEGIVTEHVIQNVARPKPEKKEIKPFSQAEVQAMLSALTHSKIYSRPGKRECKHKLSNTNRIKAILYLLLDTGIRASELCNLKIHHVNVRNRTITVMGKGSKERMIPFSARTGQVLWRYLAERKEDSINEYLFVTIQGRQLARSRLLRMLVALGDRAGVPGVNVHRFRHTFAVNYLRNEGDPYSLQIMLGHSTMEMVKTYLNIAQADLQKNHLKASPIENWHL
jgi:site-specific recombinase XerD